MFVGGDRGVIHVRCEGPAASSCGPYGGQQPLEAVVIVVAYVPTSSTTDFVLYRSQGRT